MFYGFDMLTKRCLFTASGDITPQTGVLVIEGEWGDDIAMLEYVELDEASYTVRTREYTTDELITAATANRYNELQWATEQLSILTDVCELNPANVQAPLTLNAVRAYRLAVFEIDPSNPATIAWPSRPVV